MIPRGRVPPGILDLFRDIGHIQKPSEGDEDEAGCDDDIVDPALQEGGVTVKLQGRDTEENVNQHQGKQPRNQNNLKDNRFFDAAYVQEYEEKGTARIP